MKSNLRLMTGIMGLALLGASAPLAAQEVEVEAPHKNVISANPFGLLIEFFNMEYERVVGESSTIGIGGSTYTDDLENFEDVEDEETYVNADVFYRFYPSGNPLNGWMFGAKVGVTSVTDEGSYFGFGFDVNRSWLLGKRDNFYVGIGFGLKRLVGVEDAQGIDVIIPTLRIVNVGIAF